MGILDLSVSNRSYLKRGEAGRWVSKGLGFGFCAIASQSTCIPDWEIRGNGPSSARGSGQEGA